MCASGRDHVSELTADIPGLPKVLCRAVEKSLRQVKLNYDGETVTVTGTPAVSIGRLGVGKVGPRKDSEDPLLFLGMDPSAR